MSNSQCVTIASNAGAGNQTAVKLNCGGKFMFMAEGTWGGGNIKIQTQTGNSTWVDVASSTLSANGTLSVDLPAGQVRGVITTSSAVYAYLVKMY
jgi:hypothetical protein